MGHAGTAEYVQALRDTVVLIMIEKQAAVERLEEILAVKGIDMIQWGPADYSMSIGRPGERNSPEVKVVERKVFETAIKMGIAPRAEIKNVEQAKYYLDLGVRHFNIGTDLYILHNWWKTNGDELRKIVSDA
jgi:2-keto-3-deoxy-L-rhamnonate aldolase RhmA